jgi:Carbohydrate-binding family 9
MENTTQQTRGTYRVRQALGAFHGENVRAEDLSLNWTGDVWGEAPAMPIDNFRPESSNHRPRVALKLQYSRWGIFGLFQVQDQYVICSHTSFQDRVCKDSCVEIYFQPHAGLVPQGRAHASYLNLEISGNGTLLAYHIRDSTREGDAFRDYHELTSEDGDEIKIRSTLPAFTETEIVDEIQWHLGFYLPFTVMNRYLGPVTDGQTGVQGQRWRANAFKCADDSSHPHWGSWQPCSALNFHIPNDFGYLVFE